jgi:hypothetical protein
MNGQQSNPPPPHMSLSLLDAFSRIRRAAETFMDGRDLAGLGWVEESVTDVAVHMGLPEVQVVQFSRRQEGAGVGADYLWWFVEEQSSECFGMLVQAKRLSRTGTRWTVDIRHRNGRQFADLLDSAKHFQVPAMYAIYTGGRVFRRSLPCRHGEGLRTCIDCRRMAISMISAYQLSHSWESPIDTAALVLLESTPLENLVDPTRSAGRVIDVNITGTSPELRRFLLQDQQGAREIAKRIFADLVRQRSGHYTASVVAPTTLSHDQIFPVVPRDSGHYPGPYYPHFLRGLVRSAPDYVRDIQEGRPVSSDVSNRVDGIIVATIRRGDG